MINRLRYEFDVRIPDVLIQQMMDGEITAAMLVTMTILYKWSDWNTGKVRRVCASSLYMASQKAFSERTFSEALRKLEWMRWITRKLVAGSTKWYPIIIHNYKWVDDAGKVHILNPTDVKVYDKFPEGRCDEASWEGSDEGSDEASDEGSDSLKSLLESEHQCENESSPLPKEKREVSKQVSKGEGTPCLSPADQEEETRTLYWSERNRREFTIEEVAIAGNYLMELFPRSDLGEKDSVLMAEIALDFQSRYPNPLPKDDDSYYASTVAEKHACKTMADYLAWNRKHKKEAMRHASVAEFHRAWFSDNPRCARVQWEDHDPAECKLCKPKAGKRPDSGVDAEGAMAKNAYYDSQELLLELKRDLKPKAAAAGSGFEHEEAE